MGTTISAGGTARLITATALVLFMTLPGPALFYAGPVCSKNTLSILIQCFAIACIVSLLWWAVGYSLTFAAITPALVDGSIGTRDPAGGTPGNFAFSITN